MKEDGSTHEYPPPKQTEIGKPIQRLAYRNVIGYKGPFIGCIKGVKSRGFARIAVERRLYKIAVFLPKIFIHTYIHTYIHIYDSMLLKQH